MTAKDYRTKAPLLVFVGYFKKHLGLFLLDLCSAALIAAVDLAFPLVTRKAMYDYLPNRLYSVFFTVMAAMVVCYLLRTGLTFIMCYYGHTFGIRVEADIRSDLYRHMQTLGCDFYDRNRTGSLMSRLTSDLFDLTELAHHGPEDLFISVITMVGAIVVMAFIQWRLALVIGLLVPVFLLVLALLRKRMSAAGREVKEKTGRINTEIESSLSGYRTAKAFANEAIERSRFEKANGEFKYSKRSFHKAMAQFFCSMEFFMSCANVAVIGVGGWLIMRDLMDYKDLITFTLFINTFITPMRKLANFSEMFTNGMAGLRRFTELMGTEPTLRDPADGRQLKAEGGAIRVENVSFTYDGELPVLQNVTLDVAAGETLAVVGPSGGGKTTLCSLIPRFYDVTSGAITVDGQDIRSVTQDSLHRAIGIVQQDVFLFADTVLENIRYGRPDATDEEVYEAARQAEIYDDIMAMPKGFSTYVGERGALLSGGQKQRVAIARIFLKNPPILILDEATSALDSVTEHKIQAAFDRLAKGRTTLIIAHRLSTIRNADRIVSVAQGRIAESGTHRDLMGTGGIYDSLYRTQFGDDAPGL